MNLKSMLVDEAFWFSDGITSLFTQGAGASTKQHPAPQHTGSNKAKRINTTRAGRE